MIMKWPRSLQVRLAVSLGVLLTVLWIAAATVTGVLLRFEIDQVFDSALQETAERILPLAVVDIIGREQTGITQRLSALRDRDEYFTYIVRDAEGRVLLKSHAADLAVFPAYDGTGFRQTATHRLFSDTAVQDSIRITVAEPLDHRAEVAQQVRMGLGLPVLVVIPLALLAIVVAVRLSLTSFLRLQKRLATRSAQDLSPIPTDDLLTEITPMAATLNTLLDRLKGAFDAERSFASNAAHELRTPLAGAIAQAQRLQSETTDPAARARAEDIEATLKRLTRLSERLMQLARAEGGRLQLDTPSDLRPVAALVVDDLSRGMTPDRIMLSLPDGPLLSKLDPDAFGIVCRNLLENARRHGAQNRPVVATLAADGTFTVANDGPLVPPETLARLTGRFERAAAQTDGSGLGLAIVAAIAARIDRPLALRSPRAGSTSGFEAAFKCPTVSAD